MISIEELTVEIARQRDVLKRIEALVWYEPDDEDDLVEAVRAMACERDEARRDLGAILAVIHRDGGHHTGEFGVSQSVADAHATWAVVVRERDEARAERDHERTVANEQLARAHDAVRERDEAREECAELREYAETVGLQAVIDASETYKVVVGERDIARAEVERLRARVRSVDRSTAYEGTAFSDGESSQEDLAIVASERDEARSERERLRAELSAMRVQRARERARDGWAEVERLRTALAQAQRADE